MARAPRRKPAVKPATPEELTPEVLDTSNIPDSGPQLEVGEIPEPSKPRGRPRGSSASSPKQKSLQSIETLLVGIHSGVANLLNMPELVIDEKESAALATALDAVASQYKIKLDGKQGAIAGLVGALVSIYGPRVAIIVMRKKMEGIANVGSAARPG